MDFFPYREDYALFLRFFFFTAVMFGILPVAFLDLRRCAIFRVGFFIGMVTIFVLLTAHGGFLQFLIDVG